MNQEKMFFEAILSEVSTRPCSITTSLLPSGVVKKEAHILVEKKGEDDNVVLFFRSMNDMVEIAAVKAADDTWNSNMGMVTIPWFFEKFQNDNVVPVYLWKHDWCVIHIKLEDLMEAIDFILS